MNYALPSKPDTSTSCLTICLEGYQSSLVDKGIQLGAWIYHRASQLCVTDVGCHIYWSAVVTRYYLSIFPVNTMALSSNRYPPRDRLLLTKPKPLDESISSMITLMIVNR